MTNNMDQPNKATPFLEELSFRKKVCAAETGAPNLEHHFLFLQQGRHFGESTKFIRPTFNHNDSYLPNFKTLLISTNIINLKIMVTVKNYRF